MMNIKKKNLLAWASLILFTLAVAYIFIPRYTNIVGSTMRTGTELWKLKTGSEIAVIVLKVKVASKPNPVIFVQGGPGGPIYDRNIELLKNLTEDGYTVYLYDQAGCGFSARINDISEYTVARHVQDLYEIADRTGKEKVILLGQSWGAMLATEFAAAHPEKIEKLIFTSPGPILPVKEALTNQKAPDSLQLRQPFFSNQDGNKKMAGVRTDIIRFFALNLNIRLASDKEMDWYASKLAFETGKSTVCDTSLTNSFEAGSGYYCMIKTVQSFAQVSDKRNELRKIQVPVLILKGQCDNIKWGFTAEYLSLFRNSRLVAVPNAGHGIGTEQPEIYLKTIREFLLEK